MQQVNLYQPILRKQERVFSLKTLLQGNLFVFAVLGILYGISYYQTYQLRSEHEKLQQQRQERMDQLVDLQKKFPPKAKNPQLAQEVKTKQALLDHRLKLIRELQHQNTGAGGNPGFSEQLSGLARQDVDKIWLSNISVRDEKQLTLQGYATSPDEVPKFIKRLTKESSFSGTRFTSVQISRDETNKSLVAFTLRTDDTGKGEKGK